MYSIGTPEFVSRESTGNGKKRKSPARRSFKEEERRGRSFSITG
jgi:hypothetical protein